MHKEEEGNLYGVVTTYYTGLPHLEGHENFKRRERLSHSRGTNVRREMLPNVVGVAGFGGRTCDIRL